METNSNGNIFKILIATDNHLGYLEKDAERGDDSFTTFEEILQLAKDKNVDFILLGGDLFHDNKPSRKSLLKCMELLRKFTFGNRAVCFDFVSDPTVNFPRLKNPNVNYMDPNLNVSVPVFSIHGNHDDPSGMGQFSPLDMLSTSGMINYFGRVDNLNEVKISPLLMIKGDCKLAVYGLSSIKDERLFRLFREKKVKMLRPVEDMENWFSILVLHQNHTRHSLSNYIPEEFLEDFLDLVIWGHEHECIIDPRLSCDNSFYIMQPGSSVATSLCPGEAVQKHVSILEVKDQRKMQTTNIPLRTVRPFIFEDLTLADYNLPVKVTNRKHHPIEEFVEEYVAGMIERAKEKISGHPKQPKKPLIRIRVEYEDESQMFNVCRFGYKFTETVANSDNIVLFRKVNKGSKKNKSEVGVDEDAMNAVFNADVSQIKVEDLVKQYFEELEGEIYQLQLLSERGLASAVSKFVEKDDKDAIYNIFQYQIKKTFNHLMSLEKLEEEDVEDAISSYYLQRLAKKEEEEKEVLLALNPKNPKGSKIVDENESFDSDLEIVDEGKLSKPKGRGRGGRGSRGGKGSRGHKVSTSSRERSADDEDIQCVEYSSTLKRGRARGKGRGGQTLSTAKTPSILDSFAPIARVKTTSRKSKGVKFGSDSDTD